MANGVIGGELNIQGLEEGINRIEKKLTNLSSSFTRNSNNIIKTFQDINNNGVQSLINKLDELQKAMNKVSEPKQGQKTNPFAKNVDDINRMIATLDKSTTTWNNLQRNIHANEQEIKRLTESTQKFEAIQAKIKAGGSGVVSKDDKRQYAENVKVLEVLKQQVASWKQKQQAIIQNNQAIQSQLQLQQNLRNAEQQRTSLPNQRKTQELAQMNEYYRQQEVLLRQNYEAQAKLNQQRNQQKNTTIQGALQFSDNAKSINRQQKAIEYLTQARAKLNVTTHQGQIWAEQLTQRIRQHEHAIKTATRTEQENIRAKERSAEASRRLAQQMKDKHYTSSVKNAMDFSRSTKSINDQIKAIQYLKQVRDKLNRGDFSSEKNYIKRIREINKEIRRQQTEIDRLKKKQQDLGKSHRGLIDTTGQLQRKFALLFSVSAIQGYVNKLIAVRGELELQQRALSAILQSKDEADRLWNKTMKLAIKSPFTVTQLIGYTRQLAAYRIESDKLYETNKMLADVSAGLGVDMQRLILAYGQVRAASYLRGTELRQFTEAGVPMLEELAAHFSTLEGRMVSVGDVFNRISKRMVSFQDVADVFKEMTSEGGIFFEMQEKQAETLKGMMSNLNDRITLMMNDIGEANDGTLKDMVMLLQEVVTNWREVWNTLEKVIYAFGIYKIAMFNYNTGMKVGLLTTSKFNAAVLSTAMRMESASGMTRLFWGVMNTGAKVARATAIAFKGLGLTLKAFLPIALIGVIIEAYQALTATARAAEELRKELNQVNQALGKELDESIHQYRKLADVVRDETKSYKERNDALEALNRTFGEILPQQLLELEYIKSITDNYKEANEALNLYYDAKARRVKLEKIDTKFSDELETDIDELVKSFFNEVKYGPRGGAAPLLSEVFGITKGDLEGIIRKLVEDLKSGLVDVKDIEEELFKRIEKFYDISIDKSKLYKDTIWTADLFSKFDHDINDMADTITRLGQAVDAVNGMHYETKAQREMVKVALEQRNAYQSQVDTLGELEQAWKSYYSNKKAIQTKELSGEQATETENNALSQLKQDILSLYDKLGLQMEEPLFNYYEESALGISEAVESATLGVIDNFIDSMKRANPEYAKQIALVEELADKYYEYLDLKEEIAKKNEQGEDIEANRTRLNGIRKDIDSLYKQLGEKPRSWKLFSSITQDWDNVGAEIDTITEKIIASLKKGIYNGNTELQRFEGELLRQSESLADSDFVESVIKIYENEAEKNEVGVNIFDSLLPTDKTSVDDLIKKFNEESDRLQKEVDAFKKSLQENLKATSDKNEAETITEGVRSYTKEQIEQFEKWIPIYKKTAERLGNEVKKSTTTPVEKMLDVLTDAHKTYLKHWEKTTQKTAKNRVMESHVEEINNAFKDLNMTINDVQFDNLDWIINFLEEQLGLLDKTDAGYAKIAKRISDFRAEQQGVQDDLINRKAKESLDALIHQFEQGLELSKTGMPKDIIKELFNIDVLDLDELKIKFADIDENQLGKQYQNAYHQIALKIEELERKEQNERLQKYSKYLYKAMSKRTQITLDQLKKEKEIEKTFVLTEDVAKKNNWVDDTILVSLANAKIKLSEIGITAEETIDYWKKLGFTDEQIKRISEYNAMMRENQELAKKGVALDSQKALEKLQWDEFKGAEMYEQLFGNLEQLGTKTIDILISKLTGMKSSLKKLPTEVYKEIQNSISKLEGLKIERNPFKEFSKSLEEIKKLNKITVDATYDVDGKTVTKKLKGEDAIAYQLQQKEEEIAKQRELIRLIEYAKGVEDGTVATRDKSLDALAQQNGLFEKGVNLAKKLNDAESELTAKEGDAKSLGLNLKQYEAFRKALEGVKSKTILWADSIKDVLSGFDAVLDAFGVAEDSTTRLWIQNAIKIADMIAQVIILTASLEAMGVAANSALGIIGWIAMALQAVAMLMASIFGYQDKKQQKEIERLERQVRKLESAYKDLERVIENAYSVETLKGGYEESIDNINKRITSTYKMIDAERDKKKTDQGRIDEWLEQIKELEREKKELQEEIVTGLGGSYDIRNTTREFVEAWIEAFNETGNGLHGLEENFKEFFKNILIEQAIMKGASTLMKPLLDDINASLEDDYKVSTVEMENILSTSNVVFDRVNEYLSEMFGEGSPLTDWISDSADNLTGLQRGIQGITESQADIIAAYLNSMRAYVADNNLKLTQMLDAWTNTEVENPMVAQLKIQTELIRSIKDMFSGVIRSGHPTYGGSFIKVAL